MGMLHFFFFNDTATTEIYTLSLHDALPICSTQRAGQIWSGYLTEVQEINTTFARRATETWIEAFRKQTELNQRMVQRLYSEAEGQTGAWQGLVQDWMSAYSADRKSVV